MSEHVTTSIRIINCQIVMSYYKLRVEGKVKTRNFSHLPPLLNSLRMTAKGKHPPRVESSQ
jgi:hypothetical protein